ncbi:CDP-glucose 4,6-dehydratase [Dyella sp. OK004]|uniref:CDP-glucose 4,6-dehydratase n=1 Tax=Dyella sp. OK004 TaxID=1855292 RepID=UPI0021006FE3|nr:CDP-glucose 4,6-dehydratase [Dyella sp. OK004]
MEDLALNTMFGGAYAGRRVLVTGHTGFKGSWLCLWLVTLGAKVTGLALEPDTAPAHWSLLDLNEVNDLRVDLRDGPSVHRALAQIQPEIVFHLAAQPLVRRSYREPLLTFDTNVMGLMHLLEAVRSTRSVQAVVNATTDKVYLEQVTDGGYREDHPLGGHDPYSTSKACAELLSDCYRKSFFAETGPLLSTARAGNVIGGGDWSEDRLVPDIVRAASSKQILRIRNPDAVRPWQHVLEPLSGYLRLGQLLLAGKQVEGPWNFGPTPDATMSVGTLAAQMQAQWAGLQVEPQPGDHPYEAKTLQLDCSKAQRELGWRAIWNAEDTLGHTIEWYRAYYERNELLSTANLHSYTHAARAARLDWTV